MTSAVRLVMDTSGDDRGLLLLEFQGKIESSAFDLRLATLGQLNTSAVPML